MLCKHCHIAMCNECCLSCCRGVLLQSNFYSFIVKGKFDGARQSQHGSSHCLSWICKESFDKRHKCIEEVFTSAEAELVRDLNNCWIKDASMSACTWCFALSFQSQVRRALLGIYALLLVFTSRLELWLIAILRLSFNACLCKMWQSSWDWRCASWGGDSCLVKLGACISCAGCSSDSMLALSTSCGYEWRVNVLLLQIFDARYSSVC